MKSIPHSLFAPSGVAARLSLSTNTFRHCSKPHFTYNYRQLSTIMPPPPKRKWHRPRPNGAAPNNASPHSTAAQQPKRPKTAEVIQQEMGSTGPVDVKAMYSTSAGGAEAKRFSEMAGALDQSLLNGLDKMGFEFM